jgi:hypothetical protein
VLIRECLDHVIVLNQTSLPGHLSRFLAYRHYSRCHLASAKDAPEALPRMKPGSSIVRTASMEAYDPSPNLLPYATTNSPGGAFASSVLGGASLIGERFNRILTRSFEAWVSSAEQCAPHGDCSGNRPPIRRIYHVQ